MKTKRDPKTVTYVCPLCKKERTYKKGSGDLKFFISQGCKSFCEKSGKYAVLVER